MELMNKKGFELMENWVEVVSAVILVMGFILAIFSGSAVVSYFVILFAGFMFGRWWYRYKTKEVRLPIIIICAGFLIGFLLGSFYGDKRILIILFIVGIIGSYHLHDKKYIRSVEW